MMDIDDELTNDFIAWSKAGTDKNFTIFKIYTRVLRDPKTGETGQFHLACSYEIMKLEASKNPVALIKYLVRKFLIHAQGSTGVPYEQWVVEFSPTMEKYTIPSHLFLDTTRDRAWLL